MSKTTNETNESEVTKIKTDVVLPSGEQALLSKLSESEQQIAKLETEYAEVPDVYTKEGLALARSRRAELVSMRTEGDTNRKAITKPLRDLTSSVNELWKTFSPRIEAIEKKYDDAIKKLEAEKEKARQEKAEAKQKRLDEIQARITEITSASSRVKTIEDADNELIALNSKSETILDDFEEFADVATTHIENSISAIKLIRAELVEKAEEAARLEKQRQEQEAQANRIREEQERIAKEREELEAQKRELAEQQRKADEAKEAEARAWRESKENLIASIKATPNGSESLEELPGLRTMLQTLDWELAGEYANAGESAVAEALVRIDKREELLIQAAVRDLLNDITLKANSCITTEDCQNAIEELRALSFDDYPKQAKHLEAGRDKAVQSIVTLSLKMLKEQEKKAKEEAARVEALKPEAKRVREWLEKLCKAELPVVESQELVSVVAIFDKALSDMEKSLDNLEAFDAPKASEVA